MKNRIKAFLIALSVLAGSAQIAAMQQNPYLAPRPTFTEHCKNMVTGAGQGAAKISAQLCGFLGYSFAFWAGLHAAGSLCDLINLAIYFKNNEARPYWVQQLKSDASIMVTNAAGSVICIKLAQALGRYGWPDAQ